MRTRPLLVLVLILQGTIFPAQENVVRWLNAVVPATAGAPAISPAKYRTCAVEDIGQLRSLLFSVPPEQATLTEQREISLPLPDGSIQRFFIAESPLLLPPLDKAFPEIRTYTLKGIDDPYASGKLDWNVFGLHAMVITPRGSFYIDPYNNTGTTRYISYYTRDFSKDADTPFAEPLAEQLQEDGQAIAQRSRSASQAPCVGGSLYNYRLALACTHEYAVAVTGFPAPTMVQTLSKMVVTINRVNGVFEREVAVRLLLVPTTTAIIFTSASADPFTANSNLIQLTVQSQKVIDSVIGNNKYDIGHTFSTGGGGLAQIGSVCNPSKKAQGVTGSSKPAGDPFDIDYVAHEMGHQLGGGHTFNAITGNCGGNRKAATATEPGSGITIMGYAGICGINNLGQNSIPFFHAKSIDEIVQWTRTNSAAGCHIEESTGNSSPVVMPLPSQFIIPRGTPFLLTGTAFDPNGDPLTYSWEEVSQAPEAANWNADVKPYFRSYAPDSVGTRSFPSESVIQSGDYTGTPGEFLSSKAQKLAFRFTARDNRAGGGGVCSDSTIVEMSAIGPFSVSIPDAAGIVWAQRSVQEIRWAVNGSDAHPVSCSQVNILCSLDDGKSYFTLVSTTPNDGKELLQLPAVTKTEGTCRIKIESKGNIFFDVSNNPFTISADTTVGIRSLSPLLNLTLRPNPVAGYLTIIPSGTSDGQLTSFSVRDVSGRLLLSGRPGEGPDDTYMIDLSALSSGMYVLEVSNGTFNGQSRVIKE